MHKHVVYTVTRNQIHTRGVLSQNTYKNLCKLVTLNLHFTGFLVLNPGTCFRGKWLNRETGISDFLPVGKGGWSVQNLKSHINFTRRLQ